MSQPREKGDMIMAVLAEGPATTGEIAAELEWPLNRTCAHLRAMLKRGRVTRRPFPNGNRWRRFLWERAGEAA